MRKPKRVALVLLLLGCVAGAAHGQQATSRWYRGNTHTHTLNSDGDSPPDVVVRWFREHGYQFVFVTDHEFITDVAPLNQLFGAAGKFLVMSAQEVTQRVADAAHPEGMRQAHLNALGVTRVVRPLGERNIATGTTVGATYARNIAAIRAAGGLAQVNHPNFRWSVPLGEMLGLPDSTLLEVWNGHPLVHNLGGTDSLGRHMPSSEALWDSLLTRGKYIMAIADDDSHSYHDKDAERVDLARPGRGWIMVRADTLTAESILRAIGRGEFYSTNGVTLSDYQVIGREIRVDIAQFSDNRFLTEFIGRGGKVLASSTALKPRYTIKGDEGYVRARVSDSMGRRAWMQPVRVAP